LLLLLLWRLLLLLLLLPCVGWNGCGGMMIAKSSLWKLLGQGCRLPFTCTWPPDVFSQG
jgi:hypothetical protein